MEVSLDEYEVIGYTADIVQIRHREDQSVIDLPATPEILELLVTNASEDDLVVEGKQKWSEDASRCLILLYKQHEDDFKSTTKRNDEVWRTISDELKLEGYPFSGKQAEFKWKHLRKLYLKKKENMGPQATGARPIVFPFYEEMNDIYASKHAINPIAIASSSKGSQLNANVVGESFKADSVPPRKRTNDEASTSPARTKKSRAANEILGWLEESNRKKEEAQQVRREQFMAVQKDSVNAFTDIMSKIIDKL